METFKKIVNAFQVFFASSMVAVLLLFLLVNKADAVPLSVVAVMLGVSLGAGALQTLLLDAEKDYTPRSLALRSSAFYACITLCIGGIALYLNWIKTAMQGVLLVGVITLVFVLQWVFYYVTALRDAKALMKKISRYQDKREQ